MLGNEHHVGLPSRGMVVRDRPASNTFSGAIRILLIEHLDFTPNEESCGWRPERANRSLNVSAGPPWPCAVTRNPALQIFKGTFAWVVPKKKKKSTTEWEMLQQLGSRTSTLSIRQNLQPAMGFFQDAS